MQRRIAMKRAVIAIISAVMSFLFGISAGAQTIETPEMPIDVSPFTGDQINLIIMMLCISGTALILLLLVSFLQKNKKK